MVDQDLILIPGTVLSYWSLTAEKGGFFIILPILIAQESSWRCGVLEGIIWLKKVSSFWFFSPYIYECLNFKKYFPLFYLLKLHSIAGCFVTLRAFVNRIYINLESLTVIWNCVTKDKMWSQMCFDMNVVGTIESLKIP